MKTLFAAALIALVPVSAMAADATQPAMEAELKQLRTELDATKKALVDKTREASENAIRADLNDRARGACMNDLSSVVARLTETQSALAATQKPEGPHPPNPAATTPTTQKETPK